jgi:predicted GNAT family N-acyltransferase
MYKLYLCEAMHIELKQLDFNSKEQLESIELRHQVLRKPLGLSFSPTELEAEKEQIHLAAYYNNFLAGILLLVPIHENEIKMRQVAVSPELQGKGIGKILVAYSEFYAKNKGFNKISLHARVTAQAFYTSLGYKLVGDLFEEVGIPHVKMIKKI